MAGALNFLLIACMLQGDLCEAFTTIIPQNIEVLSGSCVTIPCSLDIPTEYESSLDNTCKAIWRIGRRQVFDSSTSQQTQINGELTGDLTKKDCTTTLNNMTQDDSDQYAFRIECNRLKNNFRQQIFISVKDDPPKPTLTPSSLKQKEGTLVSLTCSAPAPCLSHPPNLTWTPGLGDSQETLKENEDKTKVRISVMNFTASHLHHRKEISCTATYHKQDGSNVSSVSTGLTADITFAPQFLPSSVCTKAATQLNCSCETVGNPSPTLQWYSNGLPINNSDKFTVSYEPLNDTSLRSIITVIQPQKKNLSNLLCHSSNSLGYATQHFYVYILELETTAESQECPGRLKLPFIVTVGVLTAALICALLFVIRTGCRNPTKCQCKGETATAVMSQGPTSDKVSEEDIYVNSDMMTKSNTPLGHQQVASKSSEKKNEEGNDMIYSIVTWKYKKKKKAEDYGGLSPPGPSYLEEERCMEGGVCRNYVSDALEMGSLYDKVQTGNSAKKAECTEYAQVHFRDKNSLPE